VNGAPTTIGTGEVVVTSVVGTGIDDATSATRVHAMRREHVRTFDVPRRWSPGRSAIVGVGGTLIVRTWENIVAVDAATGSERWSAWVHPNIVFDLATDGSERFLLLSHSVRLLEASTGAVLWSADPPDGTHCTEGLAIDRGLIAVSQCDGSFFALGGT